MAAPEEGAMADTFYTPDELAAMLKVTRQAIYNWIQQGRLEAVRIGRTVRIPGEEVERVLREGRSSRQAGPGPGEHA
jgi:excisionase family DNA binding protein